MSDSILDKPSDERSEQRSGVIAPVPFNEVRLEDAFWLPRLRTQKSRTLPFALEKTKPAVENLRRCAAFLKGRSDELPFTHRFVSSDLYKVMEGAAYLIMLEEAPELERVMDEIIAVIADAQKDDGYLYVAHACGVHNVDEMGERPYDYVLHSHELYNVGHMYEGAVAYFQATGKRAWLDVAEKSARHVNRVFFEGDPNYNDGRPVNQAPGHQEIEIGLCKLYVATGNPLYLNMARRFLDIRGVTFTLDPKGRGVMSPEYAQQHAPVSEQGRAVGHAVRAGYMYAAMADVAGLMNDTIYDAALDRIWSNLVDTKMHITGGLGAIHGIEGFGAEYDLPNKEAYNETCAAIGNVFFNHRLFLRHLDAKYFDVAEIALFNNSLAGVNLKGDRFFYVNPLEADGIHLFNHGNAGRAPWFDCACCPSNIARLMTQIAGYMYAAGDAEIYCLLYGGNRSRISVGGADVELAQRTEYPYDGTVNIAVSLAEPRAFDLKLRVPSWARERFVPGSLYAYDDGASEAWSVKVNGAHVEARLEKGFAVLSREWSDGDEVELFLPMPVRYSTCVEDVKANRGRVAVTRGPLVFCAEEADNSGLAQRFMLPDAARGKRETVETIADGALRGMPRITVSAEEWVDDAARECVMRLIPYFAWNNRGNGSMNVWFPREIELAQAALKDAMFDNARYGEIRVGSSGEGADVEALRDGRRPQHSADRTIPRWVSDPQAGGEQTVELRFANAQTVESLGVYWVDDQEGVALPESWSVDYLAEGDWKPFELYVTDFFGTDRDMYIVIHPAAELECEGLRLRINPARNQAVGLLDLDLQIAKKPAD